MLQPGIEPGTLRIVSRTDAVALQSPHWSRDDNTAFVGARGCQVLVYKHLDYKTIGQQTSVTFLYPIKVLLSILFCVLNI
jgi:hypothetical protein